MKVEQTLELCLDTIQASLVATASPPNGAFICTYGVFKELYDLEVRRCKRSGASVHMVLLTISLISGDMPSTVILNNAMVYLLDTIAPALRQGDVIAKYSNAQYVLLLSNINLEDSYIVIGRLVSLVNSKIWIGHLRLSYKVRELNIP